VDCERAAAVVNHVLYRTSVDDGACFIPSWELARFMLETTQRMVREYNGARRVGFLFAVSELPNGQSILDSLGEWSSDTIITDELLSTAGIRKESASVRMTQIQLRADALRKAIHSLIRDPSAFIERAASVIESHPGSGSCWRCDSQENTSVMWRVREPHELLVPLFRLDTICQICFLRSCPNLVLWGERTYHVEEEELYDLIAV
jgi:hypothetical protein